MKFICSKDDFLKYASYAEGAVSSKQAMQVLSNFLIVAKEESISISSTDLELSVITTFPAEVEVPGSITIHAKKIIEILKTFPTTELYFELNLKNWLSITSTDKAIKTQHKIQGLPAEEYPEVKSYEEENSFKIDRTFLKTMIKKTVYAISNEDQRPNLKGLFFKKEDDKLVLVGTDGKRLAKIENVVEELENLKEFEAIIPHKVLNELIKVLSENGECRVSITNKRAYFKVGQVEVASNLIEGTFPNYEQVIPDDFESTILLNREELFNAITRVSSMLDKKEIIQIKFDISNENLTIIGNNPDYGESRDEIAIEYNGEPRMMGFNFTYLLETLKQIDDKELLIELSEVSSRPVSIKGTDSENHINIIMPMRLTD